jgi:hypothetical protein
MYTQGIAYFRLFQILALTETSGDLVVLGEYVILRGKSTQDFTGK